jgi:2',3'-cyclic-nucleotide 2'-phosphodiesterase/3'-nucleotidase
MNALRYDAATLGNHEFDHGLAALQQVMAEAEFPFVSANLHLGAPDGRPLPLAPSWLILTRHLPDATGQEWPLRIGIIGFATPQTGLWDGGGPQGETLVPEDILTAAAREVPLLRAAGADVVVALCHAGIGPDQALPRMENPVVPLAALPGIDAIVAGHTHGVFPEPAETDEAPQTAGPVDRQRGTLHGRPVVMPGFRGSHVGVIDLLAERDGSGWRLAGQAARAWPADLAADPGAAPVQPADGALHRRALRAARRPLGHLAVPLSTRFSLIAPGSALALSAAAKREVARRLLADRPEAALPLVVAVAPAQTGARVAGAGHLDLQAGEPVLARHVAALAPYDNRICLLRLTGSVLAAWLDRAVSGYSQLRPGAEVPLFDPRFPAYGLDQFDGLDVVIDLGQPAATDPSGRLVGPPGARLGPLRVGGRVLGPDDPVIVVTNGYRASGGGGFPMLTGLPRLATADLSLRGALTDWLARNPAGRPVGSGGFRLHLPQGAGAWFLAPAAPPEERPAGLSLLGLAGEGLARYLIGRASQPLLSTAVSG